TDLNEKALELLFSGITDFNNIGSAVLKENAGKWTVTLTANDGFVFASTSSNILVSNEFSYNNVTP
ncbi:MAG: hypothetical protein ACRC7B_02240, partial [Metamycoplasmataceae bacterium]